jgi:hypothetical protein
MQAANTASGSQMKRPLQERLEDLRRIDSE